MSSRAFWAEQADLMRDSSKLFEPVIRTVDTVDEDFPEIIVKFELDDKYKRRVGFDYVRPEWIEGIDKPEIDEKGISLEKDKEFFPHPVCINLNTLRTKYQFNTPYPYKKRRSNGEDKERTFYASYLSLFPENYVTDFIRGLEEEEREREKETKTPPETYPKFKALLDWDTDKNTKITSKYKTRFRFKFEVESEGRNKIKIQLGNKISDPTKYVDNFVTAVGKEKGSFSVICLQPIQKEVEISVKLIQIDETGQEQIKKEPIGKIYVYPNQNTDNRIRIININPVKAIIDKDSDSNIGRVFNPFALRNFLNQYYFHQFLCHCSFSPTELVYLNKPDYDKGDKLISKYKLTQHSKSWDKGRNKEYTGGDGYVTTISTNAITNSDVLREFRKELTDCVKELIGESFKKSITEQYIILCDIFMQPESEDLRKEGKASIIAADSDKAGKFMRVYCEKGLLESQIAHEIGHGFDLEHSFYEGESLNESKNLPKFYIGFTELVMDYDYSEYSVTIKDKKSVILKNNTKYANKKFYYTKFEWDIIQNYLKQ